MQRQRHRSRVFKDKYLKTIFEPKREVRGGREKKLVLLPNQAI
jgi:hypothetical protein